MPVNNLLDTSTVSLSDIIGNGKIYKVPSYQGTIRGNGITGKIFGPIFRQF